MARREVAMWEIPVVPERAQRGESRSAIARTTGRSRKTGRGYPATTREAGWEPGELPPPRGGACGRNMREAPVGQGAGAG